MSAAAAAEFPHFRGDPNEYAESQDAWDRVFYAADPNARYQEWRPWLNDALHEGAPIYSRVNFHLRKAVVINQILPNEDDFAFRAYLDDFAEGTNDQVRMLVITCLLNEAAKSDAIRVIRKYLTPGATDAEIKRLCDKLTK